MSGSCVTMMTVMPLAVELGQQVHDLAAGRGVEVAGRLVGEQHGGSVTMARAMATRCCWPPESSAGVWCSRPARPTCSSAATPAPALAAGRPAIDQRQLDVLDRRGARQQVEALEDEAEVMPAEQRALVAVEPAAASAT